MISLSMLLVLTGLDPRHGSTSCRQARGDSSPCGGIVEPTVTKLNKEIA
jgi:hypothetical protein